MRQILPFWTVGLLLAILAVGSMWQRPVVWDAASWAFMARCWLTEGLAPYRDLYDVKWPLLYAQQVVAFWMFGSSLWALRLLEAGWLTIGVTGLILCVWRMGSGVMLGIGAGWLWAVTILLPVFALGGAFSEEYTASATLGAIGMALSGWPVVAGVILGLGVLIKPIALTGLLPLSVLAGWRVGIRVSLVTAGIVIGGLVWARVAIGPEIFTWIFGNLARHTGWDQPGTAWPTRAQVLSVWRQTWDTAWWLWCAPIGLLAITHARRAVLAWGVWLLAEIVLVTVQTVPVNHRWIPTVAPAILLTCLVARIHRWAWMPMVAGMTILCWAICWQPAVWAQQWTVWPTQLSAPLGGTPTAAILAGLQQAGIRPGDSIYVYPWRAELGAVYFDGQWCPRTGFTAPGDGWRLYDQAQHRKEIAAHPPEWMVILHMAPDNPDWLNQYTWQHYAPVHAATVNGGVVQVMQRRS